MMTEKAFLAMALVFMAGLGLVSANSDPDSDGDGFTDRQESAFASDPNDARSVPDLVSGLRGWWKLNEGVGAVAGDSSVAQRHATLQGETLPQWNSVPGTTSVVFDGRQNEIRVAHDAGLGVSGTVSVVCWVKSGGEGADGVLVGKWPARGTRGSFTLGMLAGRLVMELSVGGQYRPLVSRAMVGDGPWHQVAGVYDGTEVRLYVDGARVATTHTGGAVDVTWEPLIMGHISGEMRDVRLWERGLTDGEMRLLWEVTGGLAWERQRQMEVGKAEPVPGSWLPAVAWEEGRRLGRLEEVEGRYAGRGKSGDGERVETVRTP